MVALAALLAVALGPLPPPPEAPAAAGPVVPLAEALAAAKSQSPDLEVARERVAQARINVGRAIDQLKPTLSGNLAYTRNSTGAEVNIPGRGTVSTVEVNNVTANLTGAMSLFNARLFPALATARQQVDLARFSEAQVRRELLLQVAATYLLGAGLRELWAVSVKQALTTRQHAEQAQARFEAGAVQRSAALRARIDALRADEEVKRAQVHYGQTRSQLAALVGRNDVAFELEEPKEPAAGLREAFAPLLEKALADRPEMAAARVNAEIAARLKTDAWAQFLPTLGLNAQLRYNNAAGFTDQNVTWAVTVALTLPLYDGGLRYEALRDADSRTREAHAQLRGQTARVEDELRHALLDLDSARSLRSQAEQQVVLARETESLVRAQFEAGTANQVEVSDAVTALQQGEANLLRERLNVQLAALRLARAVGAFDP